MTATLRNLLTDELIHVHATTEHPDSSYNQPVWTDEHGQSYGIVGLPMLGYEVVEIDEGDTTKFLRTRCICGQPVVPGEEYCQDCLDDKRQFAEEE